MAMRSPGSSMAFSVSPSLGQTLILIASDGVRVAVNRAIATEASFVLRDLLDGQDLAPGPHGNDDEAAGGRMSGTTGSSLQLSPVATSQATNELENLFEVSSPAPNGAQQAQGTTNTATAAKPAAAKAAVPDLMDFFAVAPPADRPAEPAANTQGGNSTSSNTTTAAADDILDSLWGPSPTSTVSSSASPTAVSKSIAKASSPTTHVPPLAPVPAQQFPSPAPPPPPAPPAEVEIPFPYFTGDILERVCRHMSYRFRMSSFGTEDGCYRVYIVKTRTIPRPMTLPLVEYLDVKDRRFIADWDEVITIQMVKAATLLNYEELLQLASARLASYLIERDLEGVRTFLGVESDFDPMEEAELKKELVTDFIR